MDEPLKSCISLLPSVMRLGHRSDFDRLPLEGLSPDKLEEIALAIKARCLAELPAAMAAKMALQRREEKRRRKEEVQRDDEKHKALAQLLKYAGPEMARNAESLEEIEFDIAPKGGGPPNLGVLGYVLDLVERAGGQVDFDEIGKKVVTVFRDLYSADEYEYRPEAVASLGRQLVKRALEWREKVAPIEEGISKAMEKERTGERYIKGNARLHFAKTTPLYEAVKRAGASSLLEWYESGLKK